MANTSSPTGIQNSEDAILQQMEEHLKQKYGDFEHISIQVLPSGWDHPYDMCYMYPGTAKIEEDRFWVRRYTDGGGANTFADNYYWLVIRDEYEQRITDLLSPLFGNCKVFLGSASAEAFENDIVGTTALDVALTSDPVPRHMFWVVVDSASAADDFLGLKDALIQAVGQTRPQVRVFLAGSNYYEQVNRGNYHDFYQEGKYLEEIRSFSGNDSSDAELK